MSMSKKVYKGLYPKRFPLNQYPKFCDRLKVAMDIRDYTTQKLAKSIYISSNTVSMYRCGRRMPSPDVLCLIARELNVSTDFLLGLTDFIYV
jgi:transcriptional regulator with XRE-family HTH domain